MHAFELLRQASARHQIHLICAELPPGPGRFELGESTITAEGVPWKGRHGPRTRATFALQLGLSWPSVAAALTRDRNRTLTDALRRHLGSFPADLVQITYSDISPVIQASSVPVAALLFDLGFRQLQREAELSKGSRTRLRWKLEAQKMALWERHWLSRAEGLACVSSVDSDALAALTGQDVKVVPNPVPDTFFEPPTVERSSAIVAFVANLAWRPNAEGVIWLAREVWPRVRALVPQARLQVAGYRPGPEVIAAVTAVGGEVRADVEDVRPYLWRAAVAVSPVRLGSGLRNKVLHAMACGAPLVATTPSIEGIRVSPAEHLLVADDAESFAAALVAALRDRETALARASRAKVVAQEFRSVDVMATLDCWWRETAAKPTRRRMPARPSGHRPTEMN
jgi:glycosyltransferase involved in cell wall biosynthesis